MDRDRRDSSISEIVAEDDRVHNLYASYLKKGRLEDSEWLEVSAALRRIASCAVRKQGARFRIPPSTREDRAEDVATSLLGKFLRRKFLPDVPLSVQLRLAAKRDVITVLRKIVSVLPAEMPEDFDAAGADVSVGEVDLFEEVRARLPRGRFPEYEYVQEVLLASLLGIGDFPGEQAIKRMVPHRLRRTVYGAAVVNINTTIHAMGG